MTVNRMSRVALNLAAAVALSVTASAAQAAPKEVGLWYDDSGKGAVMVETCGDKLCGRIYWLKDVLNAEGKPLRDKYNPNESQQNRPICGLQVIGGLARMEDGEWDSGWIYDPKEGKSYSVAVKLAGPDTLKVTGYLVMKMMGRTLTWTRAPSNLPSCKDATAAAQGTGTAASAPAAAPKPSKVAAPLPPDDDIDAAKKPVTAPKAAAAKAAAPAAKPEAKAAAPAAKSAAKPSNAGTSAKAAAAKSAPGGASSGTNAAKATTGKTATGAKSPASDKKPAAKAAAAGEELPWTPAKKKAPAAGKDPAAEASRLGAKPAQARPIPARKPKPEAPNDEPIQRLP